MTAQYENLRISSMLPSYRFIRCPSLRTQPRPAPPFASRFARIPPEPDHPARPYRPHLSACAWIAVPARSQSGRRRPRSSAFASRWGRRQDYQPLNAMPRGSLPTRISRSHRVPMAKPRKQRDGDNRSQRRPEVPIYPCPTQSISPRSRTSPSRSRICR